LVDDRHTDIIYYTRLDTDGICIHMCTYSYVILMWSHTRFSLSTKWYWGENKQKWR